MKGPRRHRVFVDANVLIRGVTFPRFPYEVLRLAARHEIVLVISPSVLDDVRYYVRELFPDHLDKCEVMRVGSFLNEVMGWSHEALEAIRRRRWGDVKGDIWDSEEGN